MTSQTYPHFLSQVWAYHPSRQSLTLGAHRIDWHFPVFGVADVGFWRALGGSPALLVCNCNFFLA